MNNKHCQVLRVPVALFLFFFVVCPLIALLVNIDAEDVHKVLTSPQFQPMVINSLCTTILATLLPVSLTFALAWLTNRPHIRYRSVYTVLFTPPMLVPPISREMRLVLSFGDNGIISNLLHMKFFLHGYVGIILDSVLYSFPVTSLMLDDTFQYEDYMTYGAASVLGLSKRQQFFAITLPNIKGPLISVAFSVFTMVFIDYGVSFVVGGKSITLSVHMYREIIGLLDFSKGTIIGILLLTLTVIAFVLNLKNENKSSSSMVTRSCQIMPNTKCDRIVHIVCIATAVFLSLPLITLAVLSFVNHYPTDSSLTLDNIIQTMDLSIRMYLKNSLAIAMLTSMVGARLAYLTASMTARNTSQLSSRTLHLVFMISLTIPGVVLGLNYVLFYKGSFLYDGTAILVLVSITHFFANPYLMACNLLQQFHSNLEDISTVMGISRFRMLKDVYTPCTRGTTIGVFSYLLVSSMVTISAVSFLAGSRNVPSPLLIPQFDLQSLIKATTSVSVVTLLVNLIMKPLIHVARRKLIKDYEAQQKASSYAFRYLQNCYILL